MALWARKVSRAFEKRTPGGAVDYDNFNPSLWCVNHALHDAENVCALTKVGIVLREVNTLFEKVQSYNLRVHG